MKATYSLVGCSSSGASDFNSLPVVETNLKDVTAPSPLISVLSPSPLLSLTTPPYISKMIVASPETIVIKLKRDNKQPTEC